MKLVQCAYRFRFYPTPQQADLLNRTFGCVRVVYNRARAMREAAWGERKEQCGVKQTSVMLTALKKDPGFSWLNEVSCVPLQQSLRHLDAAYRNFFQGRARYPRFRRKDGPQSAEFTKQGFSYRNGALKLAKMDEPLNVVWSRDLPSKPTTVTVTREADGRWFVSCRVLCHVEALAGGGEVGIDLGIKDLAVLSTGEKVANPCHFAKRHKKLAREQRRLARKKTGSKNRAKAKLKVARAHAAVRYARQDFLHKLSRRIVSENQVIAVESLSVKGMLRAKLHSKAISDAAWGELVRQLTYKSMWYGRRLIKIDRFYPSTKTCSNCGSTGHALSLSDRQWTCPDCGAVHDRDRNAARNILAAGLAVSACGEGVSLGVPRHSGRSSVKQEPAL